jgi:molybdopterin converting factor small subunit
MHRTLRIRDDHERGAAVHLIKQDYVRVIQLCHPCHGQTDPIVPNPKVIPELKPHLRDEQGNVRRFLNIYVNDEDIRFLGKDYKFKEGDEVTLVPSIAGG